MILPVWQQILPPRMLARNSLDVDSGTWNSIRRHGQAAEPSCFNQPLGIVSAVCSYGIGGPGPGPALAEATAPQRIGCAQTGLADVSAEVHRLLAKACPDYSQVTRMSFAISRTLSCGSLAAASRNASAAALRARPKLATADMRTAGSGSPNRTLPSANTLPDPLFPPKASTT